MLDNFPKKLGKNFKIKKKFKSIWDENDELNKKTAILTDRSILTNMCNILV